MLKSFRKIRALFLASWQESLMYRAEALVWFIGEAIIPLVMVALWLAAYRSVDRIGNYAVEDMVSYYVMFLVLSNLLTPHLEWNTGEFIRSGTFSKHLLRPFTYQLWQLTVEVAYKGVRVVFLVPMLLLFLLLFGQEMLGSFALRWETAPHTAGEHDNVILAELLPQDVSGSFGVLGGPEAGGIIQAYAVVTMFLAGSIIPLDLMPAAVERMTHFLPFPLPVLLPRANPAGPTGFPVCAQWACHSGRVVIGLLSTHAVGVCRRGAPLRRVRRVTNATLRAALCGICEKLHPQRA